MDEPQARGAESLLATAGWQARMRDAHASGDKAAVFARAAWARHGGPRPAHQNSCAKNRMPVIMYVLPAATRLCVGLEGSEWKEPPRATYLLLFVADRLLHGPRVAAFCFVIFIQEVRTCVWALSAQLVGHTPPPPSVCTQPRRCVRRRLRGMRHIRVLDVDAVMRMSGSCCSSLQQVEGVVARPEGSGPAGPECPRRRRRGAREAILLGLADLAAALRKQRLRIRR